MRRARAAGLLVLIPVLLAAAASAFLPAGYCPREGAALSAAGREFARLKNRGAAPAPRDFDARVSLEAVLRPGDDRGRWDESRAAVLEGYVVEVVEGGAESANCFSYRG
ncbi:MAG TPA: hypothetical protein VF508_09520, partial [Pyrinomonadaceae bacterium]